MNEDRQQYRYPPSYTIPPQVQKQIDERKLREVALKDFMCAIIESGAVMEVPQVATIADQYVTAYISQLNKHS